jgi:toxin ParE1/3/4
MTVRYSRRALSQLASVHDYLLRRNPSAAETLIASLRETIARLVSLPQLGRKTDEPGVHVIVEPRYLYRVFYLLDDCDVTVLRILHRAQDEAGA